MKKDLRVFQTVKTSIGYTIGHWKFLIRIIAPWLSLYALFALLFQMLGMVDYLNLSTELNATIETAKTASVSMDDVIEQLGFETEAIANQLGAWVSVYYILDPILHIVIFSRIAIVWHRAYLLGEMQPKIRFGAVEFRFILYFVGFVTLLFIALSIAGGISMGFAESSTKWGFVIIISGLILFVIAARFLMVFPGIAVGDKRMNYRKSWQITKGNGGDLYGGLLLIACVCIPIFVIKALISHLGITAIIAWPLQLFMRLICLALLQVFLSISYQFFMPPPQAGNLQ